MDEIRSDRGLQLRMSIVLVLLVSFGLGFSIFVGFQLGNYIYTGVTILCLAIIQFGMGDRIALRGAGAEKVDPDEFEELHSIVTKLCQQSDVSKPDVAVIDSKVMNAFATGRSQKNATVCVTTELLEKLEPNELEAVLAHELAHVKNRDVAIMTAAGSLLILTNVIIRSMFYSGGGDNQGGNSGVLAIVLASIITYIISYFLIRVLSRYREHVADRSAAIMTGNPSALASALRKIDTQIDETPKDDLRSVQGFSALMISSVEIRSILSTHPKTEDRIDRLKQLQKDM